MTRSFLDRPGTRYPLSRRSALRSIGSLALAPLPLWLIEPSNASPTISGGAKGLRLVAQPTQQRLVQDERPATHVWTYNGANPGPTLRLRQGERLSVDFVNSLPDSSTVHWHGLRLPNAMDGVPHLTQPPVPPGERFHYEFVAPDAGTYWYHPHLGTPEQLGRGLYGPLIVEEAVPPAVDRDLIWVLSDWRLNGEAQIFDDFYSWSDVAFAGRVGNTVTVNGLEHHAQPVESGERIRLRLINAANARLFSLNFGDHPTWLVALDGQPLTNVQRHTATNVFLGPGQRADLIIDMIGRDGDQAAVIDRLQPNRPYTIATFDYRGRHVAPRAGRSPPTALPPNPLAEPATRDRLPITLELDGGMMRGPSEPWTDRVARRIRRLAGAREADAAWSINGRAHMTHGPGHAPLFQAARGQTMELSFRNRSNLWHPMHVHGHVFREISRNSQPVPGSPWRDTTMVAPNETLVVAFVADNPGDWLIHCHILEHHAGGMGTQFRVE